MAITRTPIIDDDGTGTTGTVIDNAWKTEFYNQIDAVTGGTTGTYTPADLSGAGLVFATAVGTWAKAGRVVSVWVQVIYPSTANSAAAAISLPFVARVDGSGSQGYGLASQFLIPKNSSIINPMSPTTSANQTNAQLSGANLVVAAVYLSD